LGALYISFSSIFSVWSGPQLKLLADATYPPSRDRVLIHFLRHFTERIPATCHLPTPNSCAFSGVSVLPSCVLIFAALSTGLIPPDPLHCGPLLPRLPYNRFPIHNHGSPVRLSRTYVENVQYLIYSCFVCCLATLVRGTHSALVVALFRPMIKSLSLNGCSVWS